MPACSKPNNDTVSDPAEPSADDTFERFLGRAAIRGAATRASPSEVPEIPPSSLSTSSEVKTAIRNLESLRSEKGIDTREIDRIDRLVRSLRMRQDELEALEDQRVDPLFVHGPEPLRNDPDPHELTELASWAESATSNQIGDVSERAAARWAEQHLGLEQGVSHGPNDPGIDHVLLDRSNNLFVAETKGTGAVGKTEQDRYQRGRFPGPENLLVKDQMGARWINRDPWMKENKLTAEAAAEKVVFRVDVVSQSIDVFGQNEYGEFERLPGSPFHCDTLDLLPTSQAQ